MLKKILIATALSAMAAMLGATGLASTQDDQCASGRECLVAGTSGPDTLDRSDEAQTGNRANLTLRIRPGTSP